MIITVYTENVPNQVVEGQRKVFEEFGERIIQISPDEWLSHPHAIDAHLKNNEWDHAIVFDIDCIPLNKDVVKDAREWVLNNIGLYSVAQNPNHIPNAADYASPAFIAFSRKTYEELGEPSFHEHVQWDVGGEFTHRAREKNIPVKLMYPSHVEIPKWKFKDGRVFGTGTTYEGKIYHHFQSRDLKDNETNAFLDKCKGCYAQPALKTTPYDRIYYINLDKRTDRLFEFQRDVIEGLGLDKTKVERISAIDTTGLPNINAGAAGCSLSHLRAWDDMIKNGYESIIVFEDDFDPLSHRYLASPPPLCPKHSNPAEEFHTTISELYKLHPEFSLASFSWNITSEPLIDAPKSKRWKFATNTILTSGYVISLQHAKLIYDYISQCTINLLMGEPLHENAIDMALRKFQSHDSLVSVWPLGIQRHDSISDIQITPFHSGL